MDETKKVESYRQTTIRIERRLFDQICDLAKRERRSMGAQIQVLLEQRIEDAERSLTGE